MIDWPPLLPTRTINVPLLRKVLEHITAHPEEWDQEVWAKKTTENSCGTACCVAGWTAVFSGHSLVWDEGEALAVRRPDDWNGLTGFSPTGITADLVHISYLAREELGLDDGAACALFAGGNSLSRLWALAHHFTNGEIEIPEEMRE